MNRISIEELEQKIEDGEEVIDSYFDANSTRVGQVYQTVERRQQITEQRLQLPESMLQEINQIAKELNISNEAVIKMMLRRSLDEHYLAKTRVLGRLI